MHRLFGQRRLQSRYLPSYLLLVLEAWLLLAVARFCLLWMPFRRTARLFGLHLAQHELDDASQPPEIAMRIGRAIGAAAGRTPWESKCLAQALACGWMLRRRRIGGMVYLGLMRNHDDKRTMRAHAWLRTGSVVLTGASGHQFYTVVARFHLHAPI